jgi:hypothetical protein
MAILAINRNSSTRAIVHLSDIGHSHPSMPTTPAAARGRSGERACRRKRRARNARLRKAYEALGSLALKARMNPAGKRHVVHVFSRAFSARTLSISVPRASPSLKTHRILHLVKSDRSHPDGTSRRHASRRFRDPPATLTAPSPPPQVVALSSR